MKTVLTAALLALAPIAAKAADNDPGHLTNITPARDWMETVNYAVNDPTHPIWFYIAGLVTGANTGSIMQKRGPIICGANNPYDDPVGARNLLIEFVVTNDLVDNPHAILEVIAPTAYMNTYPCSFA